MGYKRLALVDPRLLQQQPGLKHIQDKVKMHKPQQQSANWTTYKEKAVNSLNPNTALLQVLQEAYKHLNEALYNENITPEERLQLHKMELNKIQLLVDKNKYYLEQEFYPNHKTITKPEQEKPSPQELFITKVMENIPKVSRSRTKRLISALEQSESIKWDANGNIISIEGSPAPVGSNIITLLNDMSAFRKRRLTRPPGAIQLQQLIAQIDPNFNLVKNTLYHQTIEQPKPESTAALLQQPSPTSIAKKSRSKLPRWVK